MFELFNMGGPLFMGILTILLLVIFLGVAWCFIKPEKKKETLDLIKSIGILAAVIGILGQLIGLFDALKAIEQIGSVSPKILAAGFKVSMITTIYGLIILGISIISASILKLNLMKD